MAWIDARQEIDKIRIAIAHGNVENIPEAKEFPIPLGAPSRYGLDYVALGHWHSYQTNEKKPSAKFRFAEGCNGKNSSFETT